MTEVMTGMKVDNARALFSRFHHLVTREAGSDNDWQELEKLAVLSGVREFPVRVKCATLAWHTLNAALGEQNQTVTTE